MAIFDKEVLENFSELEKIRNMQLKRYNLELEKICKMSEEERLEQMDKMRVLLRLKELYEEFDVKVVEGEMIFHKGKAVISKEQLEELTKLEYKCFEEEKKLSKLIENDEFVLTNDTREQLNDYITIRELMLQDYIKHSINAVVPQLSPKSAFLIRSEEYNNLINLFSELNVDIKDQKLYVNEKIVTTKGEYLELVKKINEINSISIQLMEKMKL